MHPKETLEYLARVGAHAATIIQASRVTGNAALFGLGHTILEDLAAFSSEFGFSALKTATALPGLVASEKARLARQRNATPAEKSPTRMEIIGPKLWAEWHPRALALQATLATIQHPDDRERLLIEERFWLTEDFAQRLCPDCRAHFLALLHELFSGDFSADYFSRTVECHNRVNRRLGKPELSLGEALPLWVKAETLKR